MLVVVFGVLLVPSEEGMHSAGCGPSFKLGGDCRGIGFPQDVVADKAVDDAEVNGCGRACAESQHLVCIFLLGECVLAEGWHR